MLSRRTVLTGAGSALTLAACRKADGPAAVQQGKELAGKAMSAANKIDKVGIQSYTLRAMMEEDFRGTFQMIKDVGYDYVELNGRNWAQVSPADLKEMLDEIGLPSPAAHISYDDTVPADLSPLIGTAKTLGLKYAVVPYMADDQRSLDDWKRHAKVMNLAGQKLADAGLRLAYHNHQFEFEDLGGGTTAMDILMNETAPENLDFELDIFWTNLASVNIETLFKRYPGRFKLCHVKDMKGDPNVFLKTNPSYEEIGQNYMVNVGEGDTDFAAIFAMNELSGLEYFITEHDQPKRPYEASIAKSLNTVRGLSF
jgi:sugar phosphate isomerase/epimerase